MPNTVIVATATKQIYKNQTQTTLQVNAQAAFVQQMVAKMQKQMFETTRSNLGF